jgi:hypothetical protein
MDMSRRIEVYATEWIVTTKVSPYPPKVKIDILDIPIYLNENTQNYDLTLKVFDKEKKVYELCLDAYCNRNPIEVIRLFGVLSKITADV